MTKGNVYLVSELEKRLKNLQLHSESSMYGLYVKTIMRIIDNLKGNYYEKNSDDELMKDLKSVGYHDLAKLVLVGRTI